MAPDLNKASGGSGASKNEAPVKAPPSKKKEEKKDEDLVSFNYYNPIISYFRVYSDVDLLKVWCFFESIWGFAL
jgi:hypothetical protein